MASMVKPRKQYEPPPKADKDRKRLRPATKERAKDNREYAVLRELYLSLNPDCVIEECTREAIEIHHVCSGTAGRAATLLNSDTWLACCTHHHQVLEALPLSVQAAVKAAAVARTINRLKT
jgi:hypothetical protein